MKEYARCLGVAVIAAVGLWAQQQISHRPGSNISSGESWSELTRSMEKMHGAIGSIETSGNDDLDFARMMLPHHQAAIDMARAQLKYGKDPQMRRLAQEIITDQQSEIELMQLWLTRNKTQTMNPRIQERKEY